MQYILVQNKQTLLLGPMNWRPRFFQSEINDLIDNGDLSTDWKSPPVEPGYIDLGSGFEIFPVVESIKPNIDNDFEQHAGPFFTYSNNEAHESYTIVPHSLDTVKNNLKSLATKIRHHKENVSDTIVKVLLFDNLVSVDSSREARHIFAHKQIALAEGAVANVKFPEGWLHVGKQDLHKIVVEIDAHIQQHFDWEYHMHKKIASTPTIDELKSIKSTELVSQTQIRPGA